MTTVTLGNFFTSNGRTIAGNFGGSGLDTESLLESLTAAKRAPAVQLEQRIEHSSQVSAALTEFNNLLSAYNGTLDALRNPPGVGNDASNAFKYRTSTVSAADGTTGSNYLTVAAAPGTRVQNIVVDRITQLATAASQSISVTIADANTDAVEDVATPGFFTAGTITINGQDIELEDGDTLNDIASKFNSVSANTGIQATVIQISDGVFELSFTATETGTDNDFDLSVLDTNNLFDELTVSAAVGAQNAQFYLAGIAAPIERQTNTIDDVVSGLTLTLRGTYNVADAPNDNITIAIEPDTDLIQNAIINVFDAYNQIVAFASAQTQTNDDGTYAEESYLATNATFLNTFNALRRQITTQIEGLTGISTLAGIGVSFTTAAATADAAEVENIITIDESVLQNALASNFSEVEALFGVQLQSDSTNLRVFSVSNTVTATSFTLNIDPDTETYEATYDLGDGPVTVNLTATAIGEIGYTLSGQAGTALEGLQLIYGSTSADSEINVTLTQGFASLAFNTTEGAIDPIDGTFATERESLQDERDRLQEEIARIDERVALFRESLIQQFAALEQVISSVNNLLRSLAANDDARIAANS